MIFFSNPKLTVSASSIVEITGICWAKNISGPVPQGL